MSISRAKGLRDCFCCCVWKSFTFGARLAYGVWVWKFAFQTGGAEQNRSSISSQFGDFCLLRSIQTGIMSNSLLSKGHWRYAIEAWNKRRCSIYLSSMAQRPKWARAFSVSGLHDHTQTRHRLLWTCDQPDAGTCMWQNTTLLRDRRLFPRRDSNAQSKQASGRRRAPYTARQLGSFAALYGHHEKYAVLYIYLFIYLFYCSENLASTYSVTNCSNNQFTTVSFCLVM